MTQATQDFLFELGCEELPPKALPKLAQALHDNIAASFSGLGLGYVGSEWFATPRRLAVRFNELATQQADKQVERLGPAVSAAFDSEGKPKPGALGFAQSCGVDIAAISTKMTDKGERLAYIADVKGETTLQLLPEIMQKAATQLPVPKAMRWGDSSCQFSRPVHWVLAMLGSETIKFELFEQVSANITYGHRFHAPQAISLNHPSEYEQKLNDAQVVCCFMARKASIRNQVEQIAKQIDAIAVVNEDLLEEVTALVEWPVALLGNFEAEFLKVPQEALVSSMAEHQKYFHLLDKENKLLPHFITIANLQSTNPAAVIDGNEKVIRPRLADAKFFYDTDRKHQLSDQIEKLKTVVFQTQLGSLLDKSRRVKQLGLFVANQLGFDSALVSRAAELCKCDLMTNMVGEFDDLQGIMGRYYAEHDGEPFEVCLAMDEIYMPRFSGDQLPKTNTGLVLAIAERVDTLVGIFGIGQAPTGAKDPFALRRASLGLLRLISEKSLNLELDQLIDASLASFAGIQLQADTRQKLLDYFDARTLASYQDQGIPSPVIMAVQALAIRNPSDFHQRVKAVEIFNQTEESNDLAEANKRVKNILEKSCFDDKSAAIDPALFTAEEALLFTTLQQATESVSTKVAKSDYQSALSELATLKSVINDFFDKVMINVDDEKIRNNRLSLISKLRNLFLGIADISLLQK